MANSNTVNLGCGTFFLPLLTLLFIGLKLTGHITWSWIWVLAPLWVGWALLLVGFLIVFIGATIAHAVSR